MMAKTIKLNTIGFALLVVFLLTACGQKRALYLPEKPSTNTATPDSKASTQSAKEGKD
jgi:predicted small lipoprotein YifL